MAIHSLGDIRTLKDPLREYQVTFTISMFPALQAAIAQQKLSSLFNSNGSTVKAKQFELRCTSFSYPGTKIAQTELVIAGFRRKLGSLQNKSGTWECSVTENQDGGVLNTIQSWIDLIHNPFNGIRMPSSLYVSTCVVQIKPKLHSDPSKTGRTIWLKGFYPLSYNVKNINPSSSEAIQVNISFNYDWWSETPTSISALGV